MAYGEKQALQTGMQVEADVMLDTRSLLEWIFEPLLSVRGKYF
jgi:membrane fusion protein